MVQNEKLTAEEKRLVVELENIALAIDHEGPLSDRDTGEEMAEKIRLYAAQQVEHATAELREENEKLKEWKRQHLRITTPLFDYGQSKEAGLPVGSSIVQEAIKAMKECASLRKELEAEKAHREQAVKDCERWANKWSKKNMESLNLRSEIDNLKADRNQIGEKLGEVQQEVKQMTNKLAEAQRQMDEYATIIENSYDGAITTGVSRFGANRIVDLKKQISEANELIKSYPNFTDGRKQIDWASKREAYLSRLSSGETKPTSRWMHVNVCPPEPHKWYLVATPFCAYPSMAGQFNGEKWISTDQKESEIYNVEYYMEHPAPPESLIDKSE